MKFNNNVLAYADRSKTGFRFFSDIFINGILNRDLIISTVQRKAGFIFERSRFSRAVSSYSSLVDRSDTVTEAPIFKEMTYEVSLTGELENVLDFSSKDIYSILLNSTAIERKSEKYWSSNFEGIVFNFSNWYSNLFWSKIIPNETAVFNRRIFHGQVHTEGSLKRMELSNGICSICGYCEEDIFSGGSVLNLGTHNVYLVLGTTIPGEP